MTSQRGAKLLQMVVQEITNQILAGDFAATGKLPTEAQLQEKYGVSRSVVREAMKVLASQGLVSIQQGRGTFLAHGDNSSLGRQIEWALRRGSPQTDGKGKKGHEKNDGTLSADVWDNLLDVRTVLEIAAAQRAAGRANESDLETMRHSIALMRSRPEDAHTHNNADLEFHQALAGATQNPLWLALLGSFNDLLSRFFDLSYHGRENALSTAGQHEAIYEAVKNGDPEAAVAAMRKHLETTASDLQLSRQQHRVPPLNGK